MKKSRFYVALSLSLCLLQCPNVMAAQNNNLTKGKEQKINRISLTSLNGKNTISSNNVITSDTVITEDNIYEVLDYLNIERDRFTKSFKPENATTITTVGQLSEIIKNYENKASSFEVNHIESNTNTDNINKYSNIQNLYSMPPDDKIETGVRTKHAFPKLGSCQLDISGKGEYKKVISVYGNNSFTWTRALGGDIKINSSDWGTQHTLTSVDRCECSIDSTRSLRVDYKVTVETFALLKWGPLSLGKQPYSGFQRWAE